MNVDDVNFQHAILQLNAALREFGQAVDTLNLARGQLNRTLTFLLQATQASPRSVSENWCIECGGDHDDPCCHQY